MDSWCTPQATLVQTTLREELMKYEDGWKDGILAMMGTMSLQLNQAHQIIEDLTSQLNVLEQKLGELTADMGSVSTEDDEA